MMWGLFVLTVPALAIIANDGQNLVANPSGELAGTTSWTAADANVLQRLTQADTGLAPQDGDAYLGVGDGSTAIMYQEVTIADHIDGQPYHFSAFTAGSNTLRDKVQLVITFRDASGGVLDTVTSGERPTSGADTMGWEAFSTRLTRPANAEVIRISVVGTAVGTTAGGLAAYLDAVHLAANLLVNPSGEFVNADGSPFGWTSNNGVWRVITPLQGALPQPKSGARYIASAEATDTTTLSQSIDITAFPDGQPFVLEGGRSSSITDGDNMQIRLTWDIGDTTETSPATLSSFFPVGWLDSQLIRILKPVGATTATISLLANRDLNGDNTNDVYFDELYFGPMDNRLTFTGDFVFGDVHVRDPSSFSKTVAMFNAGFFGELRELDVRLTTTDGAFSVTRGIPAPSSLQPRDFFFVEITMNVANIAAGDHVATVAIDHDEFPFTDPTAQLSTTTFAISATKTGQTFEHSVPLAYSFGSVHITQVPQTTQWTLSNTGPSPGPLGVSFVTSFTNSDPVWQLLAPPPAVINPGETITMVVQYTPDGAIGTHSASVTVTTDDPTTPLAVFELAAASSDAKSDLSTQNLIDWGQLHVSAPLDPREVVITNNGTAGILHVTNIRFEGANPAQFRFQNVTSGEVLPAGTVLNIDVAPLGSINVVIVFIPGGGVASASLMFHTDDPGQEYSIPLAGLGSDQIIQITPDLSVGMDYSVRHVILGVSDPMDLVLMNTGTTGVLSLSDPVITGDFTAFNIVSDSGQTTLGPLASRTISITFDAAVQPLGEHRAEMAFTSNDPTNLNFVVVVVGVGGTFDVQQLSASTHDFGSQHINAGGSPTFNVTLQNTGTIGDVVVYSALYDGQPTSPDFRLTEGEPPSRGTRIAPGTVETFTVTFDPTTPGDKLVQLQLVTNVPDASLQFITVSTEIKGHGTDQNPVVEDPIGATLVFPSHDTEAPRSDPRTVVLRNTGTVGDVTVSDATFFVGDASDFAFVAPTWPVVLPPGDSVSISATFHPMEGNVGLRTVLLHFVTDYFLTPNIEVTIQGMAVHPNISVSPMSLGFGEVDVLSGAFIKQNAIDVMNVGLTDLHISDFVVTSLVPGEPVGYTVSNIVPPAVLPPGQSLSLTVSWDPEHRNGFRPAHLEIMTDDYTTPQVNVLLVGQAIRPLSFANVTFTPPLAAQPAFMRMYIHTADKGLPVGGAVEITFPDTGFVLDDVLAFIEDRSFPDAIVTPAERKVRIAVGASLGRIERGSPFEVKLDNVVMPSSMECLQSLTWRWTIRTFDALGGLLEYHDQQDLAGDFCIDPKFFLLDTVPEMITPPGLVEGMQARFTIIIVGPEVLRGVGAPLLDTRPGRDQVKIVLATDRCKESSIATGAIVAADFDLGIGDDTDLINATFTTAFFPGEYRLCYKQPNSLFGWEQVGTSTIVVAPKPDPTSPVFDPLPAYMYNGIVAPPSVDTPEFQDFSPRTVLTAELREYLFRGYYAQDGRPLRAKIAFSAADCGGYAVGTTEQVLVNFRATFQVDDPGIYKMCVKYRMDWEPVAGYLYVKGPNFDNSAVLGGFSSCQQYLEYEPRYCGCFYGRGPRMVSFRTQAITPNVFPDQTTVNQGCCIGRNTRDVLSTRDTPTWGVCSPGAP